MDIITIIIISMVAEAIWETLKLIWEKGKINTDKIGVIVVSMLLVFGTGIDLFKIIGIPLNIPYAGIFFTGLLISRGANWLHDLITKITDIRKIQA